ncbi:MAG: hypothetical protein RL065_1330 [Bacteroidota bacterium]
MAVKINTYKKWLVEIQQRIQTTQVHTALQVNADRLILYWYLGNEIQQKMDVEGWGAKVIEQLSVDLQKSFPDMNGFSLRNLWYMRKFAETYSDLPIVQQPVAQIENVSKKTKSLIVQQPVAQLEINNTATSNACVLGVSWSHHVVLIDKVKTKEERIWYIKKSIENNWSRNVLLFQIENDLYHRINKKKSNNFHLTLPKPQSDLANELIADSFNFNILGLKEKFSERELEAFLVDHIVQFITLLGGGFAFVGKQYKLKAGRKEYFIDLLFYHLYLRSYVVIELKLGEFKAEHAGQMNAYLNIINAKLRHKTDSPSIGIILCTDKDDTDVEFALQNINHPIGVSEYKYSKTLPKKYQKYLPSAKQLQQEVRKFLKSRKAK